jgi:hypothetical protein
MQLYLSQKIRQKLTDKVPPVSENDILECFTNRTHGFLTDNREDHLTDPFTQWFISENDYGRRLKVCFMKYPNQVSIKTAYVPNADEERIYKKVAVPI